MNAEHLAREIGEGPSCGCGCDRCGRDINTLYRAVLDQAAWIRELNKRTDSAAQCMSPERQPLASALIALSGACHVAHGVAIETGRNDVASELVVLAHKVASLLSQSMRKEGT